MSIPGALTPTELILAYDNPTIADFKTEFFRDFPYAPDASPDDLDYITDQDIAKAYRQTNVTINPTLFPNQSAYSQAYLWLSAHWLQYDINTSSQGVNGSAGFAVQSKTVGNVSESYAIPQRILDNPFYALLNQTKYGQKYYTLIAPTLNGYLYTVHGTSRPV